MDIKYALGLVILSIYIFGVFGRSEPIFRCSNENKYLPCNCQREWRRKIIHMACNNVTLEDLSEVMNKTVALGKIVGRLVFKNEIIKDIPDYAFGDAEITDLTLDTPNLESISSDALAGQVSHLGKLYMKSSKLDSIPIDLLSSLQKLDSFSITGSRIDIIKNDTFAELENYLSINLIDLSDNYITEVESGAFTLFDNLHYLVLDNNLLENLDDVSLPAHKLESISVSGNRFPEFPVNLISKVKPRGWLSLENSGIKVLEKDTIDMIIENKILANLEYNLLTCGCEMKILANRLLANPYEYDVLGRCTYPIELVGKYVTNLRPKDFENC